jgi:predicted RNA polymerase sigma factor
LTGTAGAAIDQVFRDEWGRVLASLIGYFGDFDLAEDAAAEAFAIAARRWPSDGVPHNPAAWLVTTARHRAIDRLRRDRVLAAKLRLLALMLLHELLRRLGRRDEARAEYRRALDLARTAPERRFLERRIAGS